jgi:2-haloacid dehalogenase
MPDQKRYRLITFDVYTALFDIESSLTPVVSAALGSDVDALSFVRAWRRKQMECVLISNSLQQPRLSFESITRRALDDTLARAHRDLAEAARTDLMDAWRALEPWPEAAAVLASVKARGYAVGLLSNGDRGMLQALLTRLPPVVDHVFSTEEAGYYKPHPQVYALPLRLLSLTAADVLHVAGSMADVIGTKAAGLPCAWSNRLGEPLLDGRYPPDYEMPDLGRLLEILV